MEVNQNLENFLNSKMTLPKKFYVHFKYIYDVKYWTIFLENNTRFYKDIT